MSPSCPTDGKCVSVDEMVVKSVTIVVKRLPHFFLRNNTFVSPFYSLASWSAQNKLFNYILVSHALFSKIGVSRNHPPPLRLLYADIFRRNLGAPDEEVGGTDQGYGYPTLDLATRLQVGLITFFCEVDGYAFKRGPTQYVPYDLILW